MGSSPRPDPEHVDDLKQRTYIFCAQFSSFIKWKNSVNNSSYSSIVEHLNVILDSLIIFIILKKLYHLKFIQWSWIWCWQMGNGMVENLSFTINILIFIWNFTPKQSNYIIITRGFIFFPKRTQLGTCGCSIWQSKVINTNHGDKHQVFGGFVR